MKRIHLGLMALTLGVAIVQVGCATLPASQTPDAGIGAQEFPTAVTEAIEGYHLLASKPGQKVVPLGKIGQPNPRLKMADLMDFKGGKKIFETDFGVETFIDHLNPANNKYEVFNDRSCAACHGGGGPGGAGPQIEQFMTFMPLNPTAAITAEGTFFGILNGGPVLELQVAAGAPSLEKVPVPPPGSRVVFSHRITNLTAGDGYLAAIPDYQIRERANNQNHALGISGRLAHSFFFTSPDEIGRFGWKATASTVKGFNGVALVDEQALSNPDGIGVGQERPVDINGNSVAAIDPINGPFDIDAEQKRKLDMFTSLSVAPAPRRVYAPGLQAFKKAGCAECHWTGYTTTKHGYELPEELQPYAYALAKGEAVPAFTDLLVHNMGGADLKPYKTADGQTHDGAGNPLLGNVKGAGLADGISNGVIDPARLNLPPGLPIEDPNATRGDEWRTAPLWGLHLRTSYLHDGRAKTLEQAIDLHYYKSPSGSEYDSEANQVVLNYQGKSHDRKRRLNTYERLALLRFLKQL